VGKAQLVEDMSRSKSSSTAIQVQNSSGNALWHCRIEWRNLILSDCQIIASEAEAFGSEKLKTSDKMSSFSVSQLSNWPLEISGRKEDRCMVHLVHHCNRVFSSIPARNVNPFPTRKTRIHRPASRTEQR
jgi:hypothetical protein